VRGAAHATARQPGPATGSVLSRSAAPAIPGTNLTIERLRPERAELANDTPAAVRAQIERARRALRDAALTAGHDPDRVEVDVDAALDAALADLADARVHAYLGILAERAARLTLGLRSPRSSDRRPVQDAAATHR
jgi:hypothetical protein